MIKDLLNSKQFLLVIILLLTIVVAWLSVQINAQRVTAVAVIPEKTVSAKIEETAPTDFRSDLDIGRRTVTVFDCAQLNDFDVMDRGVSIFKENAQKLFGASQLKQLNQKNTIRLDRINGDCKIKLGPIFNSPIAAN